MPRWCPGGAQVRCCGDAGTVLQWLREEAHFLQDGMRVGCLSAEHEREAERGHATAGALSAEGGALSPGARRCGDRMRRTWRAPVAQAAGVVQAGVVRTGSAMHGAGGRAADGVRGTSWVQKERPLVMHEQCCDESCNDAAITTETCDIEENLRSQGYI